VVEEVVGAPVEGRRRDDGVAYLGQVGQRQRLCRLPAGGGQAADATFQRRHPLLDHSGGGVHDAGVDVARLGQAEEGGGVRRVPEGVRGRLVDGDRPGPGGRVRGG